MSDFLGHLIGRELGAETGLRPRQPSLFEREAPAADATDSSDTIESPANDHSAPTPPLPWRRLRTDPPPMAAENVSLRAQAQPLDPVPIRTRTGPAKTPAADEPPSAPMPGREHRNEAQRRTAAPAQDETAVAAPHRAEAIPAIALQTKPSPRITAAPRAEAAPQPEPAVLALLTPLAPVSAQRTRIAGAEADESVPVNSSRATNEARPDTTPTLKPQPAQARPSIPATMPATMPLRPLPAAQTPAPSTPVETVIQVSIGRIEVRAAPQTRADAVAKGAKREAPRPTALEDYLRERQGRGSA